MKKVEKIANYNRYEPDYNDLAFDPANSMPRCDVEALQKKLDIAVEALEDAQKKLLKINLEGLNSDDRQVLYDLMFDDGTIDNALNQIRGKGK